MQKIFIGILVVVTAFQLISSHELEASKNIDVRTLSSTSGIFECPDPTAAVHFDLEACSAILNNTDMDYSEFTPEYSELVSCAEYNVVGGFLYRERPDINRHSCTPGVDSNSVAMCISTLDQCTFANDSELAIRFEIEVIPVNGEMADLGGLSFYEKAPLEFDWNNGPSGPNNYPTFFGLRILKDGVEVFSQVDIPTQNDWNLQVFDFSDLPEFQLTESALFSFEILPYCLVDNGAAISVWDIDEISILTCCGDDCSGYEASDIDFSVEVDSCIGTDVYLTLMDQTSISNPDLDVVSWEWIVLNGTDVLNFSGPSVNAVIENTNTDVTLLVTLFNGCEIESTIDFSDGVLPTIEGSGTIYSCNDQAYFLGLTSEAIDTGFDFDIELIEWTITYENFETVISGAEVNLEIESIDQLTAQVSYTYENGCVISTPVITDFENENLELDINAYVSECQESVFDVTFENVYNFNGPVEADAYLWTVTLNGVVTTSESATVVVTFNEGDELFVESSVLVTDGCLLTAQTNFDETEVLPLVDIVATAISCEADLVLVEFDLDEVNIPTGYVIETVEWTSTVNGVSSIQSSAPFQLELNAEDEVLIFAQITFSNGCQIESFLLFDGVDVFPQVDINYTVSDCQPTNNIYEVEFSLDNINNLVVDVASWTFDVNNVVTTLSGDPVTIEIPAGATVNINLDVLFQNGCANQFELSLTNFDPSVEIGIDLDIESCEGDSVLIGLSPNVINPNNYLVENYSWTIINDGNTTSYNESMLDLTLLNSTSEVTLDILFENGCTSSITEIFMGGFIPAIDIKGTAAKCGLEDFYVQYIACIDSVGLTFADLEWTVVTNEGTLNLTGDTINFQIADLAGLNVTVEGSTDEGCDVTGSTDLDPVVLVPDLSINSLLGACSGEFFDLELFNTISFGDGLDPLSYLWTVTINGVTTTYDTDTIVLQILGNDTLEVSSEVVFDGGCTLEDNATITADELIPVSDINITLVGCPDDFSVLVDITDEEILPPGYVIESESWIVNVNNVDQFFDEDPIGVILPISEDVMITHEVVFTNGCILVTEELFNTDGLIPEATFSIDGLNCDAIVDSMLDVVIYNTTVLDTVSIDEIEWFIIIDGQSTFFNTDSVMITVPIGTSITVSHMVEFANGCTSVGINTVTIDIPSITFLGDPIFACGPDDVFLVANPNPDWDYSWTPEEDLIFVGGDTSNPSANVDTNTTFFVTVDNGICSIMDSVQVIVSEMDSILIAQSDVDCDGTTVLSVIDSIVGVQYIWSLTDDFAVILGTGSTIEVPAGVETYYVSYSNIDDCTSGVASITTENTSLDFDAENPMVFCEGDTISYTIVNNDPNQTLTVVWENDPHILSDVNSESILVTIFEGEENFDLTATIENNFGCDSIIVINFMAGDIETLDFTYTLDCETLEVCFMQTTSFNGQVIWDFGDPGTDADTSLLEAPCYMFPEVGSYTIVLNSNEASCNAEAVQKIINVIDMIDVEIGADTNVIFETKELELFIFDPLDDYEYQWSTGETSSSIIVSPEVGVTTFSVTITDANGCTGVDEIDIEVKPILCNEEGIFLPNAFSPNGDGVNDVFMVRSNCLTSIDLTVYDRWGEPIFHTTDPEVGWNGAYKSKKLPPDSFAYCLIAVCATGETYETRGNVSLLR